MSSKIYKVQWHYRSFLDRSCAKKETVTMLSIESNKMAPAFLAVLMSSLCLQIYAATPKPWLRQDLSRGFGIIKMGDDSVASRFGGGAWERINGADFDGDGDIDIVATFGAGGGARGTYRGLWIYKNIGTPKQGLLDAGLHLSSDGDGSTVQPLIGDANGDTLPDVYCSGRLYLNQSTQNEIVFSAPEEVPPPPWPGPAACDWNGDGTVDHFVEDPWTLRWVNGKTGVSTRLQVGERELLQDIFIQPYVCDWNTDGSLDILVGQESGHITFIENKCGQLLAEVYLLQARPNLKSGCACVPVICDWDGDGDSDVLAGNAAGFIEFFEYHQGYFKPVQRMHAGAKEIRICAGELGSVQGPQEARWGYVCPEIADWDLDGDLDVLAGCVTGENLFYENRGSRTRPNLAPVEKLHVDWGDTEPVYPRGMRYTPQPGVLITQWRCRPVVVDWNGDGLPDYLTVDEKGLLACYLRYRRSDGTLGLKPAEYLFCDENGNPLCFCSHEKPGRNGRIKFALSDWDQDGDLDIIRNGGFKDGKKNLDNGMNFVYLECLGKDSQHRARFVWRGEMLQSSKIRLQGHSSAPFPFDIDGNGTLDIVSGCEDGNVYWFKREWIDSRAL